MPINQPPITREDPVRSSWDLEVTNLLNQLEQRLGQLRDDLDEIDTEGTSGGGTGEGGGFTYSLSWNPVAGELSLVRSDGQRDSENIGRIETPIKYNISFDDDTRVFTLSDQNPNPGREDDQTVTIPGGGGDLQQDNLITDTTLMDGMTVLSYDFADMLGMVSPALTTIPDEHLLLLGGLKLLEGAARDYTISGTTITLHASAANIPVVQQLELIIFRSV